MDAINLKKPEKIEMDGAYMAYNRQQNTTVEIGKLDVSDIQQWRKVYELGNKPNDEDSVYIGVAKCPSGDFVAAYYYEQGGAVSSFTVSGEHKCDFKLEEAEEESPVVPLDVDVMPDGNIAILGLDKVLIFDSTGTLVRKLLLDGLNESPDSPDSPDTSDSSDSPDSPHTLDSSDSSYSLDSDSDEKCEVFLESGSIQTIYLGNEVAFLVPFTDQYCICAYNSISGKLLKRLDVKFKPFRVAVAENNTLLVSDTEGNQVILMNMDGLVKLKIDVAKDGFNHPMGVYYDSATAQIYVSTANENDERVIIQYSSNGILLGCVAERLHTPVKIIVIGHETIAIADIENIQVFRKK